MNTPAHLIFGLAAFGRAGQARVTAAAFAGALLPDLTLYLMAGWHLYVLGTAPEVVFGELYFSEAWQSVFRIDNSIPLWSVLLAVGLWRRWPVAIAFAGAGLLHLGLDLALHHDDGRAHFWPFTNWIFESPVSYWDPAHFGRQVALIEIAVTFALCVLLWRRFEGWRMRGLITALAAMELLPGVIFLMMFAG